MSYCRFSDDNFRCDFYAYEGADGYHLHLAASRITVELPSSPYTPAALEMPPEEFAEAAKKHHEAVMNAPRESIELEDAGESLRFDRLQDMRNAIQGYIQAGFQAPKWLIPSLDEEIQEFPEGNEPPPDTRGEEETHQLK